MLLSVLVLHWLVVDPSEAKTIVPFKKNMDMVFKKWSCKEPKPRLVYLGNNFHMIWLQWFRLLIDLIRFLIAADEYDEYNPISVYLPHAAVVSRCEKSVGCCKPGSICSPIEEEKVVYQVDEFQRGKKQRKEIALINHLKCECQNAVQDAPR